ncbi:hypothetical protein MMC32_002464 [Xylographa parallela]|nr:hypothetical protein [Xylographa parallela]
MASAICFGHQNSGFQAGIINGSVNAEVHHHAPPQRPETPPNPSAIVPFGRDTDFIERGAIPDQIHYKCAVPGSRIALVGLGGVGKSQLAIEYAYRIQERSPETWVFWAHTSNAARFEQSYRAIANYVKISERRNPKADIFQLVHDWLRNERKGKWVLILDNIDDASFLLEARGTEGGNSQPLVSYLPQSRNGSIFITTRSRNVAQKLVEQCNIIAVEPMSRADALALFEKKLGKQRESQDIAELAVALEFMPLAIVQAAVYISQRAPRCSVRQYLEDF